MGAMTLLREDYARYHAEGRSGLEIVLLTQGFWACAVYRFTHELVAGAPRGILRSAAKALASALQKVVEVVTRISIPRGARIGPGLYFPSFGNIILSHGSIGAECTIEQNVTIGVAGRGADRGYPTIGDRVHIGSHSMIVGRIVIGDDAVVMPGSIVTRTVPPGAVVSGHPARVVAWSEAALDYPSS